LSDERTWTIGSALEWTQGYLARKGDENPRLSASQLLTYATGIERIGLYLDLNRPLAPDELSLLRDAVARRGQGEPLQYIAGEAPFRYLTVKVAPGVLIPRPETEVLVSEALALLPPAAPRQAAWNAQAAEQEAAAVAELKARMEQAVEAAAGQRVVDDAMQDDATQGDASMSAGGGEEAAAADGAPLLVADLCTGSGCIACSMASERPDTRVIAVDMAPEAVALARANVEALGLGERVRVLEGSLGDPVPERYLGRFDAVVSNPPYVPTAVLAGIPHEVAAFEPALALDGGADGLDLFRPLLDWAARALKPGGAFACELHETCLDVAAALARQAGFSDVRTVADLAGRPRVLTARKP
jgi:release factor glutamine methyltransferase